MDVKEVWEGRFIPLFCFSYRPARSPISTSKFCGSFFKKRLESAHFSPSTGTILAQAAIPCRLAHGTSLLSTSTLQSILRMGLPLPLTIHPHVLGSNLLAPLTVPQAYQALPASRPLDLHCLEYYPPRYPLGGSLTYNRCLFTGRPSQTSLSPIAASPQPYPLSLLYSCI